MVHGSEGASALLGMPGFVVRAHVEVDGELWLAVETEPVVVGCPGCGTRAIGHGRRRVRVRDLPVAGRPVVLEWAKRIWRCPDPDCPVDTWSETTEAIRPRSVLTERARAEICRRVGAEEDSVAKVARAFGVGWHTAMDAVRDYGTPLVEDLARLREVRALGVDETRFLAPTRTHRTIYVTGFVDLDRARLLDIVAGRSAETVRRWLAQRPASWRRQITVAAIDAFRGYATGLTDQLPDATLVLDHFHAVRLANTAIDDVRRRVQQATLGHRGRSGDPLYGIRRLLLVAHERLDDRAWQRLLMQLAAGDPDGEVADAYLAKELLRDVYGATDQRDASRRLVEFWSHCADAEIPELTRLARTIDRWSPEVLAFHTTGRSNGPTEAINLLIEKIRRIGHGFRNLDNYRLRLLLRCGVQWHTPPVARIRGRQPRLAA